MTPAEQQSLAQECAVFTRYLIGREPDAYVAGKYVDAHRKSEVYVPSDSFERTLLGFAVQGPRRARLADAYACLLARKSALRKKLVLLSAILESCSPSHEVFDSVDGHSQPVLLARLAGTGFIFLACLVTGVLIFGPLRLAGRRPVEPRKEAARS